ncbi:MAG: PTS sugar transporter subunit IIA [Anaerolineaceae bacterium]
MFSKDKIAVNVKAGDWKEAIRVVGGLLESAGSIKSDYTEAMINAINEFGPYIVILPNFALAHAAPSDAVLKDDIALITLAEPVQFGSPNDPVYVIMALCSTDGKSHLESLANIAAMLMEEDTIGKLKNAKTAEEILEITSQA